MGEGAEHRSWAVPLTPTPQCQAVGFSRGHKQKLCAEAVAGSDEDLGGAPALCLSGNYLSVLDRLSTAVMKYHDQK